MNDLFWWGPIVLYLVDLTIKLVALGTIPTNRRPSSSLAWLLLIFVVPILGLLIFLLIGSPFVRGAAQRSRQHQSSRRREHR